MYLIITIPQERDSAVPTDFCLSTLQTDAIYKTTLGWDFLSMKVVYPASFGPSILPKYRGPTSAARIAVSAM